MPSRVADIAVPQFDILNARAAELRAAGHPVISLGPAVPGFGPPKAALEAAAAALHERATHLYSADAGLLELREALCAHTHRLSGIPRLSWTETMGGFFAFVQVAGCTDSIALASDILNRAHVVTIPGAIFGKAGEGYLRLSYGTATVDEINDAFDRLETYFRRGGP